MSISLRFWLALALSATLLACGGGGSSATSTPGTGTVPPTPQASSGVFLDSPVAGLAYTTATQTGKTDAKGGFLYMPGETITFSIGPLRLPAVAAKAVITPLDLANTNDINDPLVSNLLVLLQSLDEDGNPANGITIPSGAAAQADANIKLDVAPAAFAANPAVTRLVSSSGSVNKTLIALATARANFQSALNGSGTASKINIRPVANAGTAQSVRQGSTVKLDGTASTDANNDPLSYRWTLGSAPAGSVAKLDSASAAKPSFVADVSGSYTLTLIVNDGSLDSTPVSVTVDATAAGAAFNMAQTLSDGAQGTTMAFSGLALMTGNLSAQSFFPPGKVADYTGFQYLRDNDPSNMGHNTSFLTRVANNMIYILDDTQLAQLSALAATQQAQIDLYGYKRFPLMQAFRRVLDGNVPATSTGLNLNAVKKASRELYLIDGQISFDRAVLYSSVINSFTAEQKAYIAAMKGKGWSAWPDITDAQVSTKMNRLAQGSKVAVMTYASDIYSWYAGSLEADVYFCPERHGTYYGGFYIKDAPAVGHEGYSIDEQMTATAGAALIDANKGYVSSAQASVMYSLVDVQKSNLNAIVATRNAIATLLRTLQNAGVNAESVKAQVLELSATYGELDGANNYHYVTTFAEVYRSLTADQKTKLMTLRQSMLSGRYADGTPFDYTVATHPYLYASTLTDAQIAAYVSDSATNPLFFEP